MKYRASHDDAEQKMIIDRLQEEALKISIVIPLYGNNKIVLYNTSRLVFENEDVIKGDASIGRNWHFEQWSLK